MELGHETQRLSAFVEMLRYQQPCELRHHDEFVREASKRSRDKVMDKKFDLVNLRRNFGTETSFSHLSMIARLAQLIRTNVDKSNVAWNSSNDLSIIMIEGSVYDYEPIALKVGYTNMLDLMQYSLTTEEWRSYKFPLPEAWVRPNLALIDDQWWREGVIDKADVAAIFDRKENWAGGSTLVGIDVAERLLSIGAYHLVEPMQHTVNSMMQFKRDFTPADRLGLLLANDPSQLHDPKSPARKSARSIMRRNMESRWFMDGGGWMPFHWLRTFEWREGKSGLSPRETMLRAYAYMPDVEPSPGIAREVEQLRKIPV